MPSSRPRPRRRRRAWRALTTEQRANVLVGVVEPLLEMFATIDAVFEGEEDALSPEKRQVTLGRVYEEWKRTKRRLDPTWRSPSQRGVPRR